MDWNVPFFPLTDFWMYIVCTVHVLYHINWCSLYLFSISLLAFQATVFYIKFEFSCELN